MMTYLKISALFAILLFSSIAKAQNLFPEKFKECDTERFLLESDTANAGIDEEEFKEIVLSALKEKDLNRIRGEIAFQIIVDLHGNSCLISMENGTNVKSKKMDIKAAIDSDLMCDPPTQQVAAIVKLEFREHIIRLTRLGLNGKRGWHELSSDL